MIDTNPSSDDESESNHPSKRRKTELINKKTSINKRKEVRIRNMKDEDKKQSVKKEKKDSHKLNEIIRPKAKSKPNQQTSFLIKTDESLKDSKLWNTSLNHVSNISIKVTEEINQLLSSLEDRQSKIHNYITIILLVNSFIILFFFQICMNLKREF